MLYIVCRVVFGVLSSVCDVVVYVNIYIHVCVRVYIIYLYTLNSRENVHAI